MLKTGRVSDQVRGLVCHDRSKRRILPYLHPSHSQEVPEVCFRGQSLPISGSSLPSSTLTLHFFKVFGCRVSSVAATRHPHIQLHRRWLILTQSEQMVAQHQDVVLAHMKVLGLRLNAKKSVLSPALRTTYLGVVWDSTTMQARMSPAWIESILTAVVRVREGRSLTVKQFQRLLGLMAAASNVIPTWPAVHETPTVVAQDQGVFPEGKPALHDQGHAAVPTCLRHVETTLVLVSGPVLGAPCRRVTLLTDTSLTGWGADILW